MKNRISKYLTHLVPAAVAKTFSFLSDHHYSALLLEDRENTEALFVQQITKWIEVVNAVDTCAFEREWSEMA
ncbi:hypothetical protein BBR47_32190 [Brevibacillus brevis NBRC 100599]|uniref:Uncharacterized protein n=2 Tax=Brevibacillus TaxID=55080 RepID=C0ZEI7_BREBN|nr:hypothetical protein [Brevibacillus brevis]BAH44196.1 hypothetical protein BBR47_32190 [Brevibacillus brevis NBRC 100599]